MSYSIVLNDIVDVDKLVDQIKLYIKKFEDHEKLFIQCKNVEEFERNLERHVPDFSYRIAQIYSSGRTLAFSVPDYIKEYLTIQLTGMLKTGIDKLEVELIGLKSWAEAEYLRINEVYRESDYNEWSVNAMLSKTIEMCEEIAEIMIFINTIKASYSYQLQAGEITSAEIRELTRAKMNTINNTGTFNNNQISNGDNNNNTMTVNQSSNEELAIICQKLIDVIDLSEASTEEKEVVKAVVYEIKDAENQPNRKDAYNKLTSAISNHITIGTAILTSNILPVLTNLIM